MLFWLLIAGAAGVYVVSKSDNEQAAALTVNKSAAQFVMAANTSSPGTSSALFTREQIAKWAQTLHVGGTRANVASDWSQLSIDALAMQGWLAFGNGVHVLDMGPQRWSQVSEATAGLLAYEIYGREQGDFGNAALRIWELESWLLQYRYPGDPSQGSFGTKRCAIRHKYITQMIQALQASPVQIVSDSQAASMGAKAWLLGSPVICPQEPAKYRLLVGSIEQQEKALSNALQAFGHALNQLFVLSLDATPYIYTVEDLLTNIAYVAVGVISAINPAAGAAVAAGVATVKAVAAGESGEAVEQGQKVASYF